MSTGRSSERWRRPVLGALVLLLLAGTASAQADVEARMREIASGLRCPVCQNLSVADSTSEMAKEMRALIADELRAGKRPEQIRAYFVSRYGEWILLSPTPRGFGLLVWVLPALGALAGLGGAVWVLRRWARRSAPPPAVVDEAILARVRAAVAGRGSTGALSPEGVREVEALRELEFDYHAGKLSAEDYEELRTIYEARAAAALASPAEPRGERRPGPVARPGPPARAWRWAAAGLFLFAFSTASGFFLAGALRAREDGSITGDFLTGTRGQGPGEAPRDLAVLLEQGKRAMATQDFARAIVLFNRALEMDADQPTAHAYLGLILLRGGHAERALRAFERALAREPTSPPALWGKALVLSESPGKTAEAIRTLETLLAQDVSKEDREQVRAVLARARARMAGQAPPVGTSTR